MPPCCAARGGPPNSLPALHLLSLHENTGVKVKDYRSGEDHPDDRVKEASQKWDYREDECSICRLPLDGPSDYYPGDEDDPGAFEIEVLVENPTCKHAFHRACLQPSVQAGVLYCPICRSVLKQSVIDDLAPGKGYVELASSDQQPMQRSYSGLYDERRNEEMRTQDVDPADEIDDLASNELGRNLSDLAAKESTLSRLTGEPEVLQYGREAVNALLKISSIALWNAPMEKLQLWHHATALLFTYNRVQSWNDRIVGRGFNFLWVTFFQDAMLWLRMDLPELRKVLIYKGRSPERGNGYRFAMGEKETSDLPGLDAAIELVGRHKKAKMVGNEPLLSDKQVKAFEFYIKEGRSLATKTRTYMEKNPPEGVLGEDLDMYIETFIEFAKLDVEAMLGGLKVFIPGLEKEKVDSIREIIKKVLSELVERFPEAEEVMEDVGYQA